MDGYSPYQLVFGSNPRFPADLLSGDPTDLVGLSDRQQDAVAADEAAASVARQHEIRQGGLASSLLSRCERNLAAANHAPKHRDQNFSRGQWAYVWRRAVDRGNLKGPTVLRGRWVGPGLVIIQSGHAVWMAMRTRLWKGSTEQLRRATRPEALGAEILDDQELGPLLRIVVQGDYNAGVEVIREGPPPSHALVREVRRDESGVSVASSGLDPDGATTSSGSQPVPDPVLNTERDSTNVITEGHVPFIHVSALL